MGFFLNEGYTYDAIGNRLGSRHQPGSWQYNGQDQLMSWGTGSQAETLSYTATGQLKQNKKALETLDYDYDATDRLTEVKRNDITLANYQYDPFGRRMSKEVNGERMYYLYSDEGLIAELNDRGNTQVAYGWLPDSAWGTNPLWQANLTTGQTLKNAAYHYLHTDHLGTPQIATNQAGNITWQAEAEAFGETHLNESNQITMNLRFPGQYYDAETDTHYNYFRDYNPRTGRYQQSDPIGLLGGVNYYEYVINNPLILVDNTGELAWFIAPLIGSVVSAGVDWLIQAYTNDWNLDCISYSQVAFSAVVGGVTGGAGPSGALFGRGGQNIMKYGYNAKSGFFNRGAGTRLGWSWNSKTSKNHFSLHGGVKNTASHRHSDLYISLPKGPRIDLALPHAGHMYIKEFAAFGSISGTAAGVLSNSMCDNTCYVDSVSTKE